MDFIPAPSLPIDYVEQTQIKYIKIYIYLYTLKGFTKYASSFRYYNVG